MKLVYPALFTPFETGSGYVVEVPDLPGCCTGGEDFAEAFEMGTDAASGWVLGELEDGNPIPKAEKKVIATKPGQLVSYLVLDMDSYAEKYGKNAVRKNLTIPAWLNTFGESQGLNFSKVLSDALEDLYSKT